MSGPVLATETLPGLVLSTGPRGRRRSARVLFGGMTRLSAAGKNNFTLADRQMWRTHSCAMPLSFANIAKGAESVGQTPRSARSPWTRCSLEESSACHSRKAGRGAGCRRGRLPHNSGWCPPTAKLSGIAHSCVPRRHSCRRLAGSAPPQQLRSYYCVNP